MAGAGCGRDDFAEPYRAARPAQDARRVHGSRADDIGARLHRHVAVLHQAAQEGDRSEEDTRGYDARGQRADARQVLHAAAVLVRNSVPSVMVDNAPLAGDLLHRYQAGRMDIPGDRALHPADSPCVHIVPDIAGSEVRPRRKHKG